MAPQTLALMAHGFGMHPKKTPHLLVKIYWVYFILTTWLIGVTCQRSPPGYSSSYLPTSQTVCASKNGKQCIYIAGLFPFSDVASEEEDRSIGQGVMPAVQLALQHVNEDPSILQNYHLQMEWNDTKCNMAVGTRLFFDMMHQSPPKVMLFGGACSHVTAPIAESSKWWRIWQLSYADTNPLLSDRETFPMFFRTVPSDSDFNPARIQFLNLFKWTRVGTLFQDASRGSSRYSHAHNELIKLLDRHHIDRTTESFSDDPDPALQRLKDKDIRIIIGNFDEAMARKVFCSAFHHEMTGGRYVWMILGTYHKNWWKVEDLPCSAPELTIALKGHFTTDVLMLTSYNGLTVSGKTSAEYKKLYDERRGAAFSKYHGYAYDGLWAIAKAVDNLIQNNGDRFTMEDFRSDRLHGALSETLFQGVTGKVLFHDGDRIGEIEISQFQDGHMVKVAEYNALLNKIDLDKGSTILWQSDSGPPGDRSQQEYHLLHVNTMVYIAFCIIASLGIIMALFFLAINIRFRNHRYIKMSSPNMNNLIIAGCLLAYVSIFLLGTDGGIVQPQDFHIMCISRSWVLSIAFTLAFGAMFSKTWRVHSIFTNIKMNRKVIKDSKLFMIVVFLLIFDVLILGAWQMIDPVSRKTRQLPPLVGDADKEIIPIVEYCTSRYMTIWMGVIYASKGIMLIFGCFLAWETRAVSIPALNDSKYIGMSVYNVVIMCVSGVPISFLINDRVNASYLLIGLFITFCTTITLCFVFVPKLFVLRKDPKGEIKRIRATLNKQIANIKPNNSFHCKLQSLVDDNERYKQILAEKAKKVEELLERLGIDNHEVSCTPNHLALKTKSDSSNPTDRILNVTFESAGGDSVISSEACRNHNIQFGNEGNFIHDTTKLSRGTSTEIIELNDIRCMNSYPQENTGSCEDGTLRSYKKQCRVSDDEDLLSELHDGDPDVTTSLLP